MWRKIVAITLMLCLYGAAIYYKETHAPERIVPTTGWLTDPIEQGSQTDPVTLIEIASEVREHAIARIMHTEGGYADHKRDPGGPTKFGITQRTAAAHGYKGRVMAMTEAQAEEIYRALWIESHAGDVPNQDLSFQYFDAYINHGPIAVRWLAQVEPQGYPNACLRLNDLRMAAYQRSKNWPTFGKGWTRRINYRRAECVA